MKKNGLLLIAVLITATCFACGCGCQQEHSFWKDIKFSDLVLPFTLLVTLLLGLRQLRMTERTTIKKEWVEKVRAFIATLILHAPTLEIYVSAKYTKDRTAEPHIKAEYDNAYIQFVQSKASLKLYLDSKIPAEKELIKQINDLSQMCLTGGYGNVAVVAATDKIVEQALTVINNKLK